MATALKLKRDINKLKAAIRSKATPQSYVPKLKAQLQKAEADYESVKAGKKSAPKASKQVKSTLDKLKAIIKKKKYGAYRAQGVDLEKDADRPALRSGKRTSKSGNTYYEYRANRIDVKQPPKRYPKLEDGGMMAEGGEIPKNILENAKKTALRDGYDQYIVYDDNGFGFGRKYEDWSDIKGLVAKVTTHYVNGVKNVKVEKIKSKYAGGGRVMPFLKFEYATEARKKLDKGQLPVFDGGAGFDYLEKEKKLYYLPSVTGDWQEVGEFKSKKESIDWLSDQLKMQSFAEGGTIDNSGMTPADLQKQIWNLTARIAKLGDIESRAASDEIEMLMKQRKKLQSMALNHGDVVMAQGGELHRSQEEKFKYGGYMAEGGVIELKSVGTYFRPSDLATSTDGTFSEDDMFYLSDIDNYEWWHGLSKEDRARIEEHFDVDKHLMDKFETTDLDTYHKEAKEFWENKKEMKGGGYMAGGGKSDEENPFVKRWEKFAQDVLLNKKIVKVRYLTNEEQKNLGWYRKAVVIQLQDGTLFFPSADDEGNDAGAIFFQSKDYPEGILPVI